MEKLLSGFYGRHLRAHIICTFFAVNTLPISLHFQDVSNIPCYRRIERLSFVIMIIASKFSSNADPQGSSLRPSHLQASYFQVHCAMFMAQSENAKHAIVLGRNDMNDGYLLLFFLSHLQQSVLLHASSHLWVFSLLPCGRLESFFKTNHDGIFTVIWHACFAFDGIFMKISTFIFNSWKGAVVNVYFYALCFTLKQQLCHVPIVQYKSVFKFVFFHIMLRPCW